MKLKHLWWKILTMLILLYALLVGMFVPLKPGILGLSKSVITTGKQNTFEVNTYNTVYSGDENQKAYLKLDSVHFLEANNIEVVSNKVTRLSFDIPSDMPSGKSIEYATLLITDKENGTIVYPEGLVIKKSDSLQNNTIWNNKEYPTLYKKEGFLFPYRNLLIESIRNTFYHIPLWFAMFILFFAAMIINILYLITKKMDYDHKSSSLIYAGILMGILGLVTGSLWAKDTWGAYWTSDVKLNMSAISMMIYLAYWILRSSIEDVDKKARISAAYSIFAFFTIVPLIFVIPRITDSLHPGNGGNPALGGEDMDHTMRIIFYPAIIGFTLLGVWIGQIILRMKRVREKLFLKMMD